MSNTRFSAVRERIEEIDRLLFDAGVLVLGTKGTAGREAADRKITDARVRLEQLRIRLPRRNPTP